METHAEALGRVAVDLGHEVVLLTTAHPRGLGQEIYDGMKVEYLVGALASALKGIVIG